MKTLNTMFGERVIHHSLWPPHSTNIIQCGDTQKRNPTEPIHTQKNSEKTHNLKCPVYQGTLTACEPECISVSRMHPSQWGTTYLASPIM
jgi:hypothetical protein